MSSTSESGSLSSASSSSSSPPPSKKSKPQNKKLSQKPTKNTVLSDAVPAKINFAEEFTSDRVKAGKSVLDFDYKKKRVRILSKSSNVKENSNGIVYWMSRDGRVQDNWAFLFAQKLALKNQCSLHVCFCLVPRFLDATIRHYKFMLSGLQQVEAQCQKLNVQFHLLQGSADREIPKFVNNHNMGAVVCDFSPLRVPMKWVNDVCQKLPPDVPLSQVDAHNIIPVWVTSDKQEYAARTIRIKVNKNLDVFLTKFPAVMKHPYSGKVIGKPINWSNAIKGLDVDMTVDEVWMQPNHDF